jgi:hypothetical protein
VSLVFIPAVNVARMKVCIVIVVIRKEEEEETVCSNPYGKAVKEATASRDQEQFMTLHGSVEPESCPFALILDTGFVDPANLGSVPSNPGSAQLLSLCMQSNTPSIIQLRFAQEISLSSSKY